MLPQGMAAAVQRPGDRAADARPGIETRASGAHRFARLNGRLTDEDRRYVEYAFVKLQNQFLHGPISALTEDQQADAPGHTLLDALRKLFRLRE